MLAAVMMLAGHSAGWAAVDAGSLNVGDGKATKAGRPTGKAATARNKSVNTRKAVARKSAKAGSKSATSRNAQAKRRNFAQKAPTSKAARAKYAAMGILNMRHAKDTRSGRMSTAADTSQSTVDSFAQRAAAKYGAGTIVISNYTRHLYYISQSGNVVSFPIATPRPSEVWTGVTKVTKKQVDPAWYPTPEMRAKEPHLPEVVEGGTPANPLGPRALYLGNSTYRIHGTNNPNSIGRSASHGCYRMQNSNILALYDMVDVGTKVVVTNSHSL
jgi:lipoprotein-anchoring transpeptidase ErfK/SrfK